MSRRARMTAPTTIATVAQTSTTRPPRDWESAGTPVRMERLSTVSAVAAPPEAGYHAVGAGKGVLHDEHPEQRRCDSGDLISDDRADADAEGGAQTVRALTPTTVRTTCPPDPMLLELARAAIRTPNSATRSPTMTPTAACTSPLARMTCHRGRLASSVVVMVW